MAQRPLPPLGTPPRALPKGGKFSVIEANPVTKAPEGKTRKYRVRGRYGAPELVFVSEILRGMGYSVTTSNDSWDIIWTVRMFPHEYKILAPFQKVNFMPGLHVICSKNLLHASLTSARARWLSDLPRCVSESTSNDTRGTRKHYELANCGFWPTGFNLEVPEQFDELVRIFEEHEARKVLKPHTKLIYIIKKPFSSCGRGVNVISTLEELLAIPSSPEYLPLLKHRPLAQEYIADVKLLDGFKYTMRIYVALTGVNPMSAYIHKKGLLRICSKRYSLDEESLKDEYVHIDSIAINKNNQEAERISADLPHDGLRGEVSAYLKLLELEYSRSQSRELWESIRDLVGLSLLSAERNITTAVASSCTQRSHTFEILGYDVLIDERLKPWLLEINHTPSLEPGTDLENEVKRSMLSDLFQLVDISSERKLAVRLITDRMWSIFQVLQADIEAGITPECCLYNEELAKFDLMEFDKSIVWILVNLELEREAGGGFELVLPSRKYLPFTQDSAKSCLAARWMSSGLSVERDVYLSDVSEGEASR